MLIRTPTFRARVLAAVFGLASLAVTIATVRADVQADIGSILAQASSGNDALSRVLGRQLADLGPQSDALLFDELVAVCRTKESRQGPRAEVLLQAFEAMGPARWRPLLSQELGTGTDPDVISPIFAIMEKCGDSADVLFTLYVAGFDKGGSRRSELEKSVTSILLRHADAFETLDRSIPAISPDLRSAMIHAAEATKHPRAALLLAGWIESRREMRFECLTYLSRLSLALQKPIAADVLAPVRALVEDGAEETIHEAVLCAGRLGDYDAIQPLIRHLKDGDYGLRGEALWSLRSITRLQFGDDPNEWSGWFAEESKWWSNDSKDAFARLASGDKAEKVAVLRRVSTLHAWRDRAAVEIAIALDDTDLEIAELTVGELCKLGSNLAVPALIDALSGGRPTVAAAAHRALETIAKRKLPSDAMACREALIPSR